MEDTQDVILHIIVVGFHHKKGYQVEFSHPQWPTGDECPPQWSHLPSIAMPDGSHNYHQETVYFHLPPIEGSDTVYGVSCYRQIDADRVLNRTEDITRKSVQKSVVALSRLPLYGQIQVKLELITTAYFETGDFSNVKVLKDAYSNLNHCLSASMLGTPQVLVGLSVRDLVLLFRHKLLVLFKLLLLERRVLVMHSPVSELCAGVLALVSLLPEMVPHPGAFSDGAVAALSAPAAAVRHSPAAGAPGEPPDAAQGAPPAEAGSPKPGSESADAEEDVVTGNSTFYRSGDSGGTARSTANSTFYRSASEGSAAPQADPPSDNSAFHRSTSHDCSATRAGSSVPQTAPDIGSTSGAMAGNSTFYRTAGGGGSSDSCSASSAEGDSARREADQQADQQSAYARLDRLLAAAQRLGDRQCGMPLRRFRKGHLCHPYLSLSDIHLLTDTEVQTLLAGATNVLYSHKRHLVDAYVTMAPCSVELSAPLRRQLALSTEDLRLADLLVRAVTEPAAAGSSASPLEPRAVEADELAPRGSDAWLRAVFRLYLFMMLRTSLLPDGSAEHAIYNSCYIAALKETPSYVQWADGQHLGVLEVNPGHPCSGQLSMADMRLKISQTFQSSERGRKVTQVAAMTGRVVGGALTVARGALSSWWSSLGTPEEATPPAEPAMEATPAEPAMETTPSAEAAAEAAGRAVTSTTLTDQAGATPADRTGGPTAAGATRPAASGSIEASVHGRQAAFARPGSQSLNVAP
ncbi:late secretory pathway protein AVL9 homolog [Pollicipes pollicipes]|uniref:late secretory pathway protein AVL9 homolog n=1 Tax=Pollicipes pollicipes TaxID=41117 RepID=UPI001884A9DA|nr:late secretory pathway protein AVL9 homolog [Pollicipes pollicipes]